MARAIILIVGFCSLLVSSCTQRLVCPAYQSAYIYDKEALRKKFSYFKEDSTPKIYTASKNKYLIADPVTYKKKVRQLQTVPMKRVNVVVPDSLKEGAEITKAELDSAANSIIDSTYIVDKPVDSTQMATDSVYVISKDREVRVLKYNSFDRKYYVDTIGFNTQQDNYMWYLRDVLLLPDAKLAQQAGGEGAKGADGKTKREKKGFKGFFKNLFKKKDKSKVEQDSTLNEKPVEEDYGYDDFDGKVKDSTSVETQPQAQTQQKASKPKKGALSFLKKKDKPAKKRKEQTDPAKKEENDDDGF